MIPRMKIAVFTTEFPALSETFVLNQVTGLLDRGHDVTVFSDRPRNDGLVHPDFQRYALISRSRYPHMPRNRLLRLGNAPFRLCGMALRNPRHVIPALNVSRFGRDALSGRLLYWGAMLKDRPRFDAILAHFGPVGEFADSLRQAGMISGPLATVLHGVDVSAYPQATPGAYRDLFRRGECFLPISEHWRRKLGELGCPENRMDVHHMGVDTARYVYRARRRDKSQPLQLLVVGRMVEKKGVADALHAVAGLIEAGHDARLTIIGDGPLRERLEQTRDALGLGERVAFLGWRKQDYIARAMREADILLAPSVTTESGDQEGIPVTIMEAMACGMIVLSTWHSGIPELVEHGKTGLLVKERDREGITRTLIDLAEASPEQWRRYSQAARLKVEADFDIASLNLELERKLRRMALTAPVG